MPDYREKNIVQYLKWLKYDTYLQELITEFYFTITVHIPWALSFLKESDLYGKKL